ncbi:MAG: SDR family oxidoreductase [Candidatus Helarchaeota archaeon]|nr:SDR family oxidoreductase [Candidatus Helarchaeota archaeon]
MYNVVITGSTKGFGFSLARKFLELGDSVVISSRDDARVKKALAKLKDLFPDGKVYGMTCDVRAKENVEALGQFAMEKLGSIDIWVNNAGISAKNTPLVDLSEADIRSVIDTNVMGAIFGCQVALKIMLKQKSGRIFNLEGMGSSEKHIIADQVPYIISKAVMPKLTKSLKLELKDTGVAVHSINPGMMVTNLVVKNIGNEPKIFNILAETPKTVADYLVPKMRDVKGKGKKLKFIKGWKVALKFMTAWRYRDRFMDKDGNLLIELE